MDLGRVYRMAFRVSSVSLTDLVGLSISKGDVLIEDSKQKDMFGGCDMKR